MALASEVRPLRWMGMGLGGCIKLRTQHILTDKVSLGRNRLLIFLRTPRLCASCFHLCRPRSRGFLESRPRLDH